MIIRQPLVKDIKEISRLYSEFYSDQFIFPTSINNVITSGVIDGKDGLLAFGMIKQFAEVFLFLDKNASSFQRAKAIALLLREGIKDAKRFGAEFLHLSPSDEETEKLLVDHFDFQKNTDFLVREL